VRPCHLHSRHTHPNILPHQLTAVCCVICRLFHALSPHCCHIIPSFIIISNAFHCLTTSPPFRLNPTIPNDILSIWSTMEPLKHSSGWLMEYFQYFILYNAKCCCSWRKVTASQPQSRPRPPRRHRMSPPSPPIYYRWMRRVDGPPWSCPRQETTLRNKSQFSRVNRRW